jgi:hypothetical protein
VPPVALQQVASRLALEDPGLAAQSVDRVSEERRAAWIVGTAGGIATNDLARGLAFVERFRSQSVYGNARAVALQAAIGTAPVEVAREIERDPAALARLTPAVAAAWSAQDAPAAARWLLAATGIEEPARASAAGRVAERWTASDQGAATRWVLDLPAGAVRDAGLTGLLVGDASATALDPKLLEAFGSADARGRAIEQAISVIGGRNPELLPALVRAHIQDPERAEAILELAAPLRALRGQSGLAL